MGPGDDKRVIEAADLFDTAPVPDALARFLGDPTHHLLIAYSAGTPAGFVSGCVTSTPETNPAGSLAEYAIKR